MTNDRRHGSVPYHVNLKVSIACHAITREIHDLLRVSTELQILRLSEGRFFVCSVIDRIISSSTGLKNCKDAKKRTLPFY
jgi:hypothetical protein